MNHLSQITEITYEEATYTDEERKEAKDFVNGAMKHRKEVIKAFDAINKAIKCLSKKDDNVSYTLTLGIHTQKNSVAFQVLDWNEFKYIDNSCKKSRYCKKMIG